jgi:triacylglycerol esterase/lipase EstA (alpha/beta hydrolase family)
MNRNRSGRRYDREFKNEAVALVRGGRTITEVARDLERGAWVNEVIFLATPHRGTRMADASIAQLGRKLVGLPAGLLRFQERVWAP